jgi:hypothetical protein
MNAWIQTMSIPPMKRSLKTRMTTETMTMIKSACK